jgi:hypothetical protein
MPIRKSPFPSAMPMQRLAHAWRLLRPHGFLLDAPAPWAHAQFPATPTLRQSTSADPTEALPLFVTRLQELLAATDEPTRKHLEDEVLDLAVPLHVAGIFEVLNIANPALATMIDDHLSETVSG